jgi:5-methyltetrahydrofolate--homocysteine methyltransferase
MNDELIARLKQNVIEGRKTGEDEGVSDELSGTPGVVELTQQAIDSGLPAETIITSGLTAGMQIVGEKFSTKEYFIPDMLASAEAVGAAMDLLKPILEKQQASNKGKFIIVTVKGDIHDIGKNIVAILIKGAGYEVIDLGIDIPEDEIVKAVEKEKPDFLGLSALLTTTMQEMGTVIKALESNSLRDKVKVLIGGAAVSEDFAREIGADAFCADGFQALKVLEGFAAARN